MNDVNLGMYLGRQTQVQMDLLGWLQVAGADAARDQVMKTTGAVRIPTHLPAFEGPLLAFGDGQKGTSDYFVAIRYGRE